MYKFTDNISCHYWYTFSLTEIYKKLNYLSVCLHAHARTHARTCVCVIHILFEQYIIKVLLLLWIFIHQNIALHGMELDTY